MLLLLTDIWLDDTQATDGIVWNTKHSIVAMVYLDDRGSSSIDAHVFSWIDVRILCERDTTSDGAGGEQWRAMVDLYTPRSKSLNCHSRSVVCRVGVMQLVHCFVKHAL